MLNDSADPIRFLESRIEIRSKPTDEIVKGEGDKAPNSKTIRQIYDTSKVLLTSMTLGSKTPTSQNKHTYFRLKLGGGFRNQATKPYQHLIELPLEDSTNCETPNIEGPKV